MNDDALKELGLFWKKYILSKVLHLAYNMAIMFHSRACIFTHLWLVVMRASEISYRIVR